MLQGDIIPLPFTTTADLQEELLFPISSHFWNLSSKRNSILEVKHRIYWGENTHKYSSLYLQAHEMILNALCGFEDSALFSGGYDRNIKQWNLDTLECVGTCEVGFCINTICTGTQGQVYVAGDNGFLTRLDNK
jgi:WD40 repeat protein